MSLLVKGGGITKLSELLIDADKDWQAFGISNLEELALAMAKGDFAVRGDTVLQRLQPSTLGYVLTSAGLLHIPSWQPPPGPLLYYFPAPIDLSHTEAKVVVNHSISKPDTIAQRLATSYAQAWDDQPGLLIKQIIPLLASVVAPPVVIAAADKFIPSNAPVKSALSILCDGFVEEAAFDVGTHDAADSFTIMTDSARAHWVADALIGKTIYNITDGSSAVITDNDEHTATGALVGGGDHTWQAGDAYIIRTNNTVNARSAGANDINLCPQSDTVLDKIYIGSLYKFWQAQVQVGTNGSDNWLNEPYYWDGAAWAACVDAVDGSNSFMQGIGLKFITHTPQIDWALSTIMGMNLYWMMIRTDVWTHRVTKPLGSQVWVAIA